MAVSSPRAVATIHETGDPIPWVELFLAAVQTRAGQGTALGESRSTSVMTSAGRLARRAAATIGSGEGAS